MTFGWADAAARIVGIRAAPMFGKMLEKISRSTQGWNVRPTRPYRRMRPKRRPLCEKKHGETEVREKEAKQDILRLKKK